MNWILTVIIVESEVNVDSKYSGVRTQRDSKYSDIWIEGDSKYSGVWTQRDSKYSDIWIEGDNK